MWNIVISYSLRCFLKVSVIIIMRFGENNVLGPKYINIYEFGGRFGRDLHIPPYIFLFIIQKNAKSTRAWPILKLNSTPFWFNFFFLGWIIKKLQKGAQGAQRNRRGTPISLRIEYSSSNWFYSDTPNSRHLFNINC